MSSVNPISNSQSRQGAGFYRWESAGEPASVYFHLNTVELLERDIIRAGKSHVAGILLGKRDESRQLTFIVENYEPVPAAVWKSTDSPFGDRRQLKALIERWQARPDKRVNVLGFYRSAAAGESALSEDDLSVLGSYSGVSESVFLLIEPRSGKPSSGKLFFCKDGVSVSEWDPILFNRVQLSGRGFAKPTDVQQSPAPRPRVAPKPSFERPVEEEPEEAASSSFADFRNFRGFRLPWKWQWVAGAVVALAILALTLYQLRQRFQEPSGVRPAVSVVEGDLQLKADRSGADWRVSWNTDALAAMNATKGWLLITDGGVTKTVELDSADLHSGTILYSPLTDDLVFRMSVTAGSSSQPLTESVRVVGGLPSNIAKTSNGEVATIPGAGLSANTIPAAGLSASAGANYSLPASVKKSASNPVISTDYDMVRGAAAKSASRLPKFSNEMSVVRAAKPSNKPSTTSPSRSSAKIEKSEGSALSSVPARAILPSDPVKPMPETIPVISVPPSTAALIPTRKGGAVQPAQLITNVNPSYPTSAKDSGVTGSVELHFKIGITGNVHDVTVVRGEAILAQSAVQAVRERRYRPARVDGVPTETDASAIFDFRLN
jgi:TonB family protein